MAQPFQCCKPPNAIGPRVAKAQPGALRRDAFSVKINPGPTSSAGTQNLSAFV